MKRIFLLPIFLLLTFWGLVGPAEAVTGHVKGRVSNGTTRKPASGTTVTLIRIGPDRQDRVVGSTKTSADGSFTFPAFQVGADEFCMAQTQWQGQRYEQIAFDGTGRIKEVLGTEVNPDKIDLTIFNASSKLPQFTFLVHHLAIERAERTLKCVERIVAQQQSDYVYDGSAGAPKIKLQLPSGARDVALDPKVTGTIAKEGDFYYYTLKDKVVKPVSQQRPEAILINYVLDWPASLPWNRKLDLSHKVFYPTNYFFVARPPDAKDLKVTAPRLGADDEAGISNSNEQIKKIINSIGNPMSQEPALKAGDSVEITVQQPVNPLVWAFVMFVGALIAIVPLVLRTSGHRVSSGDFEGEEIPSNLQEPSYRADVLGATFGTPAAGKSGKGAKAGATSGKTIASKSPSNGTNADGNGSVSNVRELIFSIAQLDEDFADGRMDEQSYQSRRALWKNELMGLLEEPGKSASSEMTARTKK